MGSIFLLIKELGFPIAVALGGGFFIFFIIKYILSGVTAQVKGIHGIIMGLENRIKTMNNDIIKIDAQMNDALGLEPETDRIARADGKIDARKD
jgi:hypothetical protein|tara:strand:+ start:811 stop:1092 length:282 start_codon:yes stop_codon:yes gene_type:complete